MGFFKNLFSNDKTAASTAPEPAAAPAPDEAARQAARIYERLQEHTGRPTLSLSLTEEEAGLFESKLGGAFYVPDGEKPPQNAQGAPLYLLAQLNFGELPPLEDFPREGLLQIFLDGTDDVYGIDFSDPARQNGWRIRYLTDLPDVNRVPRQQICQPACTEETSLPLPPDAVYRLTPTRVTQPMTTADWRIHQAVQEFCRDLVPDDIRTIYDLDDDLLTAWQDLEMTLSCQVGGYPYFTQYDPREEAEDAPDVLLFQLDSAADIMWGDCGVGNFFIRRADLAACDFSYVWYNWDCC